MSATGKLRRQRSPASISSSFRKSNSNARFRPATTAAPFSSSFRHTHTRSRPRTAFSTSSFTHGPAISLLDSADIAEALKGYYDRHPPRADLTDTDDEESELSDSDSDNRLVFDDGAPHVLATAGLKDEQISQLMDNHVPRMKVKRRLEGHDSQVLFHIITASPFPPYPFPNTVMWVQYSHIARFHIREK